MKKSFYITTPIYYATAKPHLGSLYSTVLADVLARWQRLCGKDVFFLTGTDEHGQKIAQAAQKAGMKPKEFVDSFIGTYKEIWKKFNIDYSYFIRTTDHEHIASVQKWLTKLIAQGDIYKGFYEGWYCISCEAFVLHDENAQSQQAAGKSGPVCHSCDRATVALSEETYFFKLSAYRDILLNWYKSNPDIVLPNERLHEIISFVEAGLKDLSISRATISWGIPFPNDTHHVTYVWADALLNYITAVGYAQEGREHEFNKWWPADVQVMGKDILRFHAIYWPAFLVASGLPLPKHLLVHGWIKIDKEKMSKSRDNVVDPEVLFDRYGADSVRYYLVKEMSISQDTEFSYENLEQRINADLANDLGNLLNRVLILAQKHDHMHCQVTQTDLEATKNLFQHQTELITTFSDYMEKCQMHMAYAAVWKFIHQLNAYFHGQEPWKKAIHEPVVFKEVIATTVYGLYAVGLLVWPVMPERMTLLLESLGATLPERRNSIVEELTQRPRQTFTLTIIEPLFKKIEMAKQIPTQENSEQQVQPNYIDITDLAKVELAVGTIISCQAVPNSKKLYQLNVDIMAKNARLGIV